MEKDAIFETAERYVKYTGKSIFLTGRAGTGKTTFLKYIAQSISKRFVILAPTGVAAINAGGSTIHSFFQLPLCPYLPDVKELVTEYQTPDRYRSLRKERIKIISTLDLLIIDEISMVRADLMDAVDMTLRKYRRNEQPFGGVQLLMIGDIHQLSPVVKESERQYISQVYSSPYFFHSKALGKMDYITIELQKVYRQKDAEFIGILNAVRDNKVTPEVLEKLNSRVGAPQDMDEVVRLTTHNAQADNINALELVKLSGKPEVFTARIEGDFPSNNYPADEFLSLKEGARVMFVRNDPQGKYYNGKMGTVLEISAAGNVLVEDFEGGLIEVEPVVWENIQYEIDQQTSEIVPVVVGKFRQLPLRIAWAVTIHKSQGLTFDKVIIDAGAAFAFGQVYVALSRCRTLEGISLETPISASSLYNDSHISRFNEAVSPFAIVQSSLGSAERAHRFNVLREIFNFEPIVRTYGWYMKNWRAGYEQLYPTETQTLLSHQNTLFELRKTADTFSRQLTHIETSGATEEYLAERLEKASGYFLPSFDQIRECCNTVADLEIDNKETKKKAKDSWVELMILLDIICGVLGVISDGKFSVENYSRIKTENQLKDRNAVQRKKLKKEAKIEVDADAAPHQVYEQLKQLLQQWRTERFKKDNVPAYTIIHQSTLLEIASKIPQNMYELGIIKGMGKTKCKKYGAEILAITVKFAAFSTKDNGSGQIQDNLF